jgi:hypothetical protein
MKDIWVYSIYIKIYFLLIKEVGVGMEGCFISEIFLGCNQPSCLSENCIGDTEFVRNLFAITTAPDEHRLTQRSHLPSYPYAFPNQTKSIDYKQSAHSP